MTNKGKLSAWIIKMPDGIDMINEEGHPFPTEKSAKKYLREQKKIVPQEMKGAVVKMTYVHLI